MGFTALISQLKKRFIFLIFLGSERRARNVSAQLRGKNPPKQKVKNKT